MELLKQVASQSVSKTSAVYHTVVWETAVKWYVVESNSE